MSTSTTTNTAKTKDSKRQTNEKKSFGRLGFNPSAACLAALQSVAEMEVKD